MYGGIFASIYEDRAGRSLKKGREGYRYNIYETHEFRDSIRNDESNKIK